MACANASCGFMIKSAQFLLLYSLKAQREMTSRLSEAMVPIFLLLVVSGCFLADGLPSAEEKQISEILKRLEAKIEKQEAQIEKQEAKIQSQEAKLEKQEAKIEKQEAKNFELHRKNEALRRDMSDQLKRMETKANRTEEALEAIRDRDILSATGDKAVRDLPYIMKCAYRGSSSDTGIIAFDKLTLDYSNCDRPGETLLKQCPNTHLGGGCSSMDIASGTFTAQTGGLYTVTFSGQADLYSSSALVLYLLHNGSQLKETHSYSYCGSGCAHVEEMLSRTLVSIYLSQLACKKCLTHKFTDTDFRY